MHTLTNNVASSFVAVDFHCSYLLLLPLIMPEIFTRLVDLVTLNPKTIFNKFHSKLSKIGLIGTHSKPRKRTQISTRSPPSRRFSTRALHEDRSSCPHDGIPSELCFNSKYDRSDFCSFSSPTLQLGSRVTPPNLGLHLLFSPSTSSPLSLNCSSTLYAKKSSQKLV